MKVLQRGDRIRSRVNEARADGLRVGFVPTMGALHRGHMELVRSGREECDRLAVSIFVNPDQFDREEAVESYPRSHERDRTQLSEAGVDWLFLPSRDEVYPPGDSTEVVVRNRLTRILEADHREHFFDGVTGVMTRFLHMIPADRVYFGEKDLQQLLVMRQMLRDLRMPHVLRPVPVVRDRDGVAFSSRNRKLDESSRGRMGTFFSTFVRLKERSPDSLDAIRSDLRKVAEDQSIDLEYVELVTVPDLTPTEPSDPKAVLVVAGTVGSVRFKDNLPLHAPSVGALLEAGATLEP